MTGDAATTDNGVHYAYCPACDWLETYRSAELAREKAATHDNYVHAGFGCRAR